MTEAGYIASKLVKAANTPLVFPSAGDVPKVELGRTTVPPASIPPPPARGEIAKRITGGLNDVTKNVNSLFPEVTPYFQIAKEVNNQATQAAEGLHRNYLAPGVSALRGYTATNNLPRISLPSGKGAPLLESLTVRDPAEAYNWGKQLSRVQDWRSNISGGVRDAAVETVPALGPLLQTRDEVSDIAKSEIQQLLQSSDSLPGTVARIVEPLKKYSKLPMWRRALGLTTQRPVVPKVEDFNFLQDTLNAPAVRDVVSHGLTHDPELQKSVLSGAVNPISVGNAIAQAGTGMRNAAEFLPSRIGSGSAAGRKTSILLSQLARRLPAIASAGRLATGVGRGLSAAGLVANTALEIPRIVENEKGFGGYVNDFLSRQTRANNPLTYGSAVANNLVSPVGTLSGLAKLLTEGDTYRGILEYLRPTASPVQSGFSI